MSKKGENLSSDMIKKEEKSKLRYMSKKGENLRSDMIKRGKI